MKVVRNTPDQLILKSTPWLFGLLLSAGILVSVSLGLSSIGRENWTDVFWGVIGVPAFLALFMVIFVRRDDLILDRQQNIAELRHATFFGRKRIRHELAHLDRAIVQQGTSRNSTTYRVAIILNGGMDAGTHPVTEVYASGNGARTAADAINAWLAGPVDSGPPQA